MGKTRKRFVPAIALRDLSRSSQRHDRLVEVNEITGIAGMNQPRCGRHGGKAVMSPIHRLRVLNKIESRLAFKEAV